MATQKEIVTALEAKADAIQTLLDEKQEKIDASFVALKQQVKDLQDQIAAGETIDLQPLADKLNTLADDLATTPEG